MTAGGVDTVAESSLDEWLETGGDQNRGRAAITKRQATTAKT